MNYKDKSTKQEKSVAKQFNGKTTISSGAIWFDKADVRSEKFLIECKTTQNSFYSVTSKVWEKVDRESCYANKTPLLIVDLKDAERFVVFNPNHFGDKEYHYECTSNGINKKSYRISIAELEELKEYDFDCVAKLFVICGDKRNMLMYMRLKDFMKYYKEEL